VAVERRISGELPFWRRPEGDTLYNARVKIYGDTMRVTVFNTPTFNPDGWEPATPRRRAAPVAEVEAAPVEIWTEDGIFDPFASREANDKLAAARAETEAGRAELARQDNIRRAKQKVYDIAFANQWDLFGTFTLDAEKCDRYDADGLKRFARGWLSNRVQRAGLRYLGVPERHKDGALHLHFLMRCDLCLGTAIGPVTLLEGYKGLGLADSGTVLVEGRKKPVKLATARRQGYKVLRPVFNVADWPLGFSTAIPVYGPPGAVAHYLAKYLTKDSEKIFGKRYLAGGDIAREVETLYTNLDYEAVEGKAYHVAPRRSVKYFTVTEGEGIL